VAGSRGLLSTLCFCATGDEVGALVEDFLRAGPKVKKLRRRRSSVRLPGDGTNRTPEDGKWRPENVLSRILRVASGAGRADVVQAIEPVEDWVEITPPEEAKRMPMTVAAFARRPRANRVRTQGGSPHVEAEEKMLELAVMISASANTSVYRDTMTTTRVDEKLDLDRLERSGGDLSMQTQLLVELAAEVTDSATAAYYRVDPVRGTLVRITTHVMSGIGVETEFPSEIPGGSRCVAAVAVARRRPVAHGWDGPVLDLEPTLPVDGSLPGFVEIATPVPGPLASSRAFCAGVLTVLRLATPTEEPTPYAAYDHALLRNVALRLALLHATEDMEAASELFRDLTIRGSQEVSRRSTVACEPGAEFSDHPVPDDVRPVLPSITTALAEVARLTASHSATFRLALPNADTEAAQGVSLVRLAAHSEDGLLDRRRVQDLTGKGVNCLAARTGIAQNVPFVKQNENYDAVRGRTMSEISVPVTVEGMVVGVVNLESPVERSYDARVSTAIAFAEHVGTVLADARLANARQLHQYATQIVKRGHDLSGETRRILDATASSPAPVRREVDSALRSINERARGIAKFDPHDGRRAAATLPDLARAAWQTAGIWELDSRVEATEEPWRRLDREVAGIVFECLRHVFVNVQNHMPIDAEGLAQVEISQGVPWGGRRYDLLRVRNEARQTIDPLRAVNLYRVPIVDRKKRTSPAAAERDVDLPRFGAYLAGNQARAIGGNVHLALESPRRVRLTVMVPQPIRGGASD
jgi:GAF domain-containing protein